MLLTASPTAFRYVECDVPEGQTLAEWRRNRTPARRPSLLRRLGRTGR
jgi:hypothetical protein